MGDNEIDFGKLFLFGEKVKDGGFYFSKKKQAFFCWSAGI